MAADTLASLQTLLQLGWPAIVTLACVVLWRSLAAVQDARMDDMKHVLTADLVDIHARLTSIEDELKITRVRAAILPSVTTKTDTT